MAPHQNSTWFSRNGRALWLNGYPLVAIMVWMVILSLSPRHGTACYVYQAAHYALLPLCFGINILSRMIKSTEHPPVRLTWPDLSMVLYVVLVVVSVSVNDDLPGGLGQYMIVIYRTIFVPFSAYWLVRSFRPGAKDLERLTQVMVTLCIIEIIVGCAARFKPEILPNFWPGRVEQFGGFRITGTFSQPDVYCAALIFFLTFIFQYAVVRGKALTRSLCLILFNAGLIGIFLSYSRASWLSALVFLSFLAFAYKRLFLLFVLPVLLLGGGLLGTIFTQELSSVARRIETLQTVGNRVISGYAGTKMFLEKPVLGWGYGSYDLHDSSFIEQVGGFKPSEWDLKEGTSHNTFLTILAETGMVGLCLYAFTLGWWLLLTIKIWLRLPGSPSDGKFLDRRFLAMLWANIVFIMAAGQFVDIRFFPFTLVQVWLILGLIANMVDRYQHPSDTFLFR